MALLEVERGSLPERLYFLKPRSYTVGRARDNDLCLSESSISKVHARILYEDGGFAIEDQGSLHGVYVDAEPVRQRAPLRPGARLQLGNVTLKFSAVDGDLSTDPRADFPWLEQQKLLLSLVQALNSTLVLSEVLDQVLDAVMRITRAERAFLLLADGPEAAERTVAGDLRLRLARGPNGPLPLEGVQGISRSVVRRALETGRMVATGNAAADPSLATAQSVASMELRTIVCTPLPSRSGGTGVLGALYVDNQESSAPFSAESLETVDALGRHAALAIENAQLFEREERRLEELRQAQQQLLQSGKLATIGQMSAGIAHELNTPLTYIMGNVELLLVQPLTETQREMLDAVGRGAERIKTLVQRLLAFSRPAHEDFVALDVNELVERSLEFCHYQILKAGVHLEKRLAPDLPAVRGVASQLETALINLIVNAVQAMGEGGRLTVETAASAGVVQISVTDTGAGIPDDAQPRLFEPFFTTKPEGEGTGLGLSSVLMAVERHHGQVAFDTRPGAGTTFRITLSGSV